jgi:hypothetical protein
MNLCNIFKQLEQETWNRLKQARNISCPYGEETITDINLHRLITYRIEHPTEPNQLMTKIWNKTYEGRHGGDWEWWFTGPSKKWFGIRIQAKILDHFDNFEHLHYRSGKMKVLQSDRLIQKCNDENIMPLYCLYCFWEEDKLYPVSLKCKNHVNIEEFGCSLIDAYTVRDLRPKKHISDVSDKMFPWHCLFCCKDLGKIDLPNRVKSMLINFAGIFHNTNPNIFELHQEPPYYVSEIMNGLEQKIHDRYLKRITVIADEKT